MHKFTTSTNIERDVVNDINYVVTPNAKNVFERIVTGFQQGHHSFNIIGSYGTGKSSFLWALEKNLNDKKPYFANLNGQFKDINLTVNKGLYNTYIDKYIHVNDKINSLIIKEVITEDFKNIK